MKKILKIALPIIIVLSLCSCSSVEDGAVSYVMQKTQSNTTAPDGTLVYSGEADYPVIKIQGNKSAAKLVNKGIEAAIHSVTSPEYDYISEYNNYKSQGLEYISSASYSCSVISTCINDEYLSFQVFTYSHEACSMRDMEYISGLTFSAVTGEETDIYELSSNDAQMQSVILSAVTLSGKSKREFDPDIAGNIIKSGDFSWYITDENLVIIIDPGKATPISEGSITAEIPLEKIP